MLEVEALLVFGTDIYLEYGFRYADTDSLRLGEAIRPFFLLPQMVIEPHRCRRGARSAHLPRFLVDEDYRRT